MLRNALVFAATAFFALAPSTAIAQQDEGSASQVLSKALSSADNPDGVFRIEGDAAVHIQSGLRCQAYLDKAFLLRIFIFESPEGHGMDVGCDYARRAAPGSSNAAAKHTVFAVKLPAGGTLEDAFEQYRAEMHNTAPNNARNGGPSLTFDDPPDGFPEFLSEELFYQNGGREWQTEVVVAIQSGWIVEMRSTRVSQYAVADIEEGMDQMRGISLFFSAIFDLGGPDFHPKFEFVEPTPAAEPESSQQL